MQEKIADAEKFYSDRIHAGEKIKQQMSILTDELVQKQMELSALREEQDQLRQERAELNSENTHIAVLKHELTEDVGKRLVNIFRQVIVALHARDKGLQKQMKQYLMKTSESALKLPPALSQMIMEGLATIKNKPESPSRDR